MHRRVKSGTLLGLALALVACDHFTKWLAVHALKNKSPFVLNALLDFRYVENHDVAFHLLRWIPDSIRTTVIFAMGLSTSAILLLVFVLYARRHRWMSLGFVLILAGAAGNLSDRWIRGFVVDFIHVHVQEHSFPVFNLADIYVTLGIALLAWATAIMPADPPPHLSFPPPALPPHLPTPYSALTSRTTMRPPPLRATAASTTSATSAISATSATSAGSATNTASAASASLSSQPPAGSR